MKNLIDLAVIFGVFLVGGQIAPEHIACSDWKVAITAAIVMTLFDIGASFVVGILTYGFLMMSADANNINAAIATLIIGIVVYVLIMPIGIYICSEYVTGFHVSGILAYAILTLCITTLTSVNKSN